jgi:hypothetical protein
MAAPAVAAAAALSPAVYRSHCRRQQCCADHAGDRRHRLPCVLPPMPLHSCVLRRLVGLQRPCCPRRSQPTSLPPSITSDGLRIFAPRRRFPFRRSQLPLGRLVASRPATASVRWEIFRMWCRRCTAGLVRPPPLLPAPLRPRVPLTTCRVRRMLPWLGCPLPTVPPTLPLSPTLTVPPPAPPPTCRVNPPSRVSLCQQRLQPPPLPAKPRRQ